MPPFHPLPNREGEEDKVEAFNEREGKIKCILRPYATWSKNEGEAVKVGTACHYLALLPHHHAEGMIEVIKLEKINFCEEFTNFGLSQPIRR
jgi:hypothetical protein